MTAIITTSDSPLRIKFTGVLDVEDGSAPTVCLNDGNCEGCIDNERCNGGEE